VRLARPSAAASRGRPTLPAAATRGRASRSGRRRAQPWATRCWTPRTSAGRTRSSRPPDRPAGAARPRQGEQRPLASRGTAARPRGKRAVAQLLRKGPRPINSLSVLASDSGQPSARPAQARRAPYSPTIWITAHVPLGPSHPVSSSPTLRGGSGTGPPPAIAGSVNGGQSGGRRRARGGDSPPDTVRLSCGGRFIRTLFPHGFPFLHQGRLPSRTLRAPVRHTSAHIAIPPICGGHIDRKVSGRRFFSTHFRPQVT
jgi:hypothetical protein